MASTTGATLFKLPTQPFSATRSFPTTKANPSVSSSLASTFVGASLPMSSTNKNRTVKMRSKVTAAAAVATTPMQEITEYVLPSWAMFELGRAPVYWKTMNGLPPTSGQKLKLFYNPAATKLNPNEEFGIAFNGGFNQPIMCGGEPRAMLRKERGKADPPIYTIQICIPKHAVNLIFSFTNGVDWDGPYRLQFQVPKAWQNRPIEFFNEVITLESTINRFKQESPQVYLVLAWILVDNLGFSKNNSKFVSVWQGLAQELSKEGACEKAIFPDANIVISRCAMIGNLSIEGGDRCNLDLVPGCMDRGSHMYNPLANVDDGSCPIDSDVEN